MLKKSFSILNSLLILVIIAFLIDIVAALPFVRKLGLLSFLLIIPLKVMFYSGCFGSLFEISSGEEFLVQYKNFTKNIKSLWKIYAFIMALPSVLYLLISLIFADISLIPLRYIYVNINLFILFFLSTTILRKKYFYRFSLKKRKLDLPLASLLNIILLYIVSSSIFYIPTFFKFKSLELVKSLMFFSRYLNFLTFIYISNIILRSYPEIAQNLESRKELFLVFPVDGKIINSVSFPLLRVNPPVFTILNALTPPEYNIRKFNKVIWRERYYKSDKLVAITCFTSNCYEAYEIAKRFKACGSKVIMGGPHVSLMAEEALEFCDSVVIGEAEGVWSEVVADYENGRLKKIYNGIETEHFSEKTHNELLNSSYDIIGNSFETTRGCKYRCDFCTIFYLTGRRIRKRPIAEIIELVKKFKATKRTIFFIDNNIYADPQYAKKLFKALKPLNIKWRSQCSLDIAKDDEALRLAKESGCEWMLFGYEITEDSDESKKGGKYFLAKEYKNYTKKVQKMGIQVKGQFIFGFDNDTFKTLLKMWKFCLTLHLEFASVSFLTPLPGSKFLSDILNEGRLTNMNWRAYDIYTPVFQHKKMNNTALKIFFNPLRILILLTTSVKGIAILLLIIATVIIGFSSV